MDNKTFLKCRYFLISQFETNSSYSFNDPTLMIDHSINVQKIAMSMATQIDCNKEVIFYGSIFHDIGKTKMESGKPIPWEILREKHEAFNFEIMKELLIELQVEHDIVSNLEKVFTDEKESVEGKLIKDADIIEFYMNIRLQKVLDQWSRSMGISGELQRKADKYNDVIHFELSKRLALPYLELMKNRWHLN